MVRGNSMLAGMQCRWGQVRHLSLARCVGLYMFTARVAQPSPSLSGGVCLTFLFSTFKVTHQTLHHAALAYTTIDLRPIVPDRTFAAASADLYAKT
jgi:hypothetical protein